MNKNIYIYTFIAIGMLLILWSLAPATIFSSRSEQAQLVGFDPESGALILPPAPSQTEVGESLNQPVQFHEDNQQQKIIEVCLGAHLSTQGAASIEDVFLNLMSKGQVEDQIENWHVRYGSSLNPENEERFMLIPATQTESAKSLKELRRFKVDAEGLPIPVAQKGELYTEKVQREFERSLAQGEVFFHQKKQSFQTSDKKFWGEAEWLNGKLRMVQIQSHNGAIGCFEGACRCLK